MLTEAAIVSHKPGGYDGAQPALFFSARLAAFWARFSLRFFAGAFLLVLGFPSFSFDMVLFLGLINIEFCPDSGLYSLNQVIACDL